MIHQQQGVHPAPRHWSLHTILQYKRPELLREMTDFKSRVQKIQDEPGVILQRQESGTQEREG